MTLLPITSKDFSCSDGPA